MVGCPSRTLRLRPRGVAPSLEAPVPSCPEWTLFDLVQHLGTGQRWWAAIVAAGPAEAQPAKDAAEAPRELEALLAWYAQAEHSGGSVAPARSGRQGRRDVRHPGLVLPPVGVSGAARVGVRRQRLRGVRGLPAVDALPRGTVPTAAVRAAARVRAPVGEGREPVVLLARTVARQRPEGAQVLRVQRVVDRGVRDGRRGVPVPCGTHRGDGARIGRGAGGVV
nr:maleylpyruvate isomerase N-terminal domain-containing protein [Streptomyces sp. DSM 40907]